MSLFLGKIHFWLFDKIKWFENLEEEVLKIAKERNMPVEEWISYANLNFGEKTPNIFCPNSATAHRRVC